MILSGHAPYPVTMHRLFDLFIPSTLGDSKVNGSATTPASSLQETSTELSHKSRLGRVYAIDAARGVAIIGMTIVNVGPTDANGLLERLYLLPYGRASLLFVLLAGLSMTYLFRSGDGTRRHWPVVLWRAGIFLVGGLALQLLGHDVSVILPVYGGLFVLALLARRLPDAILLAAALLLSILGPMTLIATRTFEGLYHSSKPATLLDEPTHVLHTLFLSGPYPLATWCVPFLLGMWLGRRKLLARNTQTALIVTGAALTVVGFLLAQVLPAVVGSASQSGYGLLLTGVAHGQMPLWLVSGLGSAMFVLGALLRLWPVVGDKLWSLAAAGQLALTVYVFHLVVLSFLRPEPYSFATGALISLIIVVSAIGGATLWRKYFQVGPLEALLRLPSGWARSESV